ncbi:hypothetical protein [Bacillus sp. NTK034]|uniref:hypothetical protein n=1 Tax=Bacillus sp. NTK034 TaxID=2802176 RepID=UPI001A8DC05B|nr:hypothetical protein [Bacillus sp. NTK034]MBN8203072.1 hypothetical protein [Bacillus sp. NTK034]
MGHNRKLIRTEGSREGENQSEYEPDSDRMKQKRRKAVRIQARFGQDEAEKAKSSPNTSQVRTG